MPPKYPLRDEVEICIKESGHWGLGDLNTRKYAKEGEEFGSNFIDNNKSFVLKGSWLAGRGEISRCSDDADLHERRREVE